ncbi:MAG: FHA domain-containing protein [Prevotella sp.]|nr:FHA domain-containing protein [Prevotella sp.]
MDIIIGRNAQTRQLSVMKDGKTTLYGQAGSVPMDVSRQHMSLMAMGDGKWMLKNLNAQNVTFVNGVAAESKTVTEADKIELGNSRYQFPWKAIQEKKEESVDIRPLAKVWEEYNEEKLQLQIAERKFNAARSAVGVITMLAIACSFILGHGPIYLALYAVAIGVSILFAIRAYNNSSEIPKKQEALKKQFQRRYTCPKCGHFMGWQDYDIIIQGDACPYCRTKYKK